MLRPVRLSRPALSGIYSMECIRNDFFTKGTYVYSRSSENGSKVMIAPTINYLSLCVLDYILSSLHVFSFGHYKIRERHTF